MSREVKMGVDTLRKYLYELRDAGWLEIGKQGNGGRFGAAQYTLKALPYGKISDTENFRHGEFPTRKISDTENLPHLNNIDSIKEIDTIKKTKGNNTQLALPFSSERFREVWEMLCEEKEWKKKTKNALQMALKRLAKYDEAFAIELMEKTIEKGCKGVVFDDTDAKYQEWLSARQQAKDNQQPRAPAVRPKPPQNSQIDEFYRKQREKEEQERAEQIAAIKAKYGNTD